MPIHDWTRVEAGIFHAFHHGWISAISNALNSGLLPKDSYALPELIEVGFASNVSMPHKKSSIALRHIQGDRIVAIMEIVSPGNKASKHAIRSFVQKACELAGHHIHLLMVDLIPSGPHDPNGINGLIWSEMSKRPSVIFRDKPFTIVSYECEPVTEAYSDSVAIGEVLPNMPLFLEPNGCIMVPLEGTYMTAFNLLPRRWRDVLQPSAQ